MTGTEERWEEQIIVSLPERIDRHLRLGPFPSARSALKFVSYAAVGALLVPVAGPWAWIPFLGVGFVVSVYRADGKSPDVLISDYARYQLRVTGVTGDGRRAASRVGSLLGRFAKTAQGRYVVVLAIPGIPTAFLPPQELRELFAGYREFLRASDGGVFLRATLEPLPSSPFRPHHEMTPGQADRAARSGYEEMVTLLCRRRYRRKVLLVLWSQDHTPEGVVNLEERTSATTQRLSSIGLVPVRLEGPALLAALRRLGWSDAEAA